MNIVYLRVMAGLQAGLLALCVFIVGVVREIDAMPPDQLKIPHNLFYLDRFGDLLARLSGVCLGLAMAAAILALAVGPEWRVSRLQAKVLWMLIILAPAVTGVLEHFRI